MTCDRVLGIRYVATITVSGRMLNSLELTRRHYRRILQKVLPVLLRHLPGRADGQAPEKDLGKDDGLLTKRDQR